MCFFHLNPIPRNSFSCFFDSYLIATIFVVGKSPGSPCSSNVWTCCCCSSPPGQLGNMCLSPTSNKLHQFPGNSGCCFRLLSLGSKQLYIRHEHSRGTKVAGEPVLCPAAETLEEMQQGEAQTPSSQYPHH